MRPYEELYVLRRARRFLRPDEDTRELCDALRADGLLRERHVFLLRGFRLTALGREQILRAEHSRDKVARAIATGLFDDVPFPLFAQLVASPEIERYIEGQRQARRLIMLAHLQRGW